MRFAALAAGLALMWLLQAASGATIPPGEPEYTADVWQVEEGLPQISVTSIAQTLDGYLWIGTFNGLARFDGVRFVVFDEGNTPALGSSRIVRLDVDSEGCLWIVTEPGGLVRMAGEEFTAFAQKDGLPPSGVLGLVRDEAQRLLVLDRDGGLRRLQHNQLLPLDRGDPLLVTNAPGLLLACDGRLWIAEGGRAIRSQARPFTAFSPAESNPPPTGLVLECAVRSHTGGYWLASTTTVYRLEAGRFEPVASLPSGSGTQLHFLIEDTQGRLWFGGPGNGLVQWQPGNRSWNWGARAGLRDNHISALFCDREGNVWLGTGQGGLHRFKRRLVQMYDPPDASRGTVITSVTEDRQGRIWAGVNGAGLHQWAPTQRGLIPVAEPSEVPRFPLVYSVLVDREDAMWIGLYGRTVLRVQGGEVAVCLLNESLLQTTPRALFEDRAGSIWLGTERGLQRYQAGQFTRYSRQEGLSNDDVRALAQDRAGTLYIGTSGGGLNCLRAGRFSRYTEQDGLADNHVTALCVDPEDTVWIGTANGGLCRFKEGRFASITVDDGLPSNTIGGVLEDDAGNLWLSSNRGLIRVNRRELQNYLDAGRGTLGIQVLGRSDGLNSIGCGGAGQPTGCKSRDGTLWFATVKGLARVNPRELPTNPLAPPVVIEEVVLVVPRVMNDQQAPAHAEKLHLGRPSKRSLAARAEPGDTMERFQLSGADPGSAEGRVLRVPPQTQRLEFRYTGLSLVAPEKVRFRYRLEGFEKHWTEAGPRRTAQYTQVPPGHYRFQVTACNNDGVWNDAGAVLPVVVLPAWWQTWWFRSAVVIAVGGGLFLALRARLQRANRERVAQQTFTRRLLDSQEAERKRIAAGLHDSLGQDLLVIKNRALLGLQEDAATANSLEQFQEISTMASQTIEEVREISRDLRPYQIDRLGLTKAIEVMAIGVSKAMGIPIRLHLDPINGLVPPQLEIHFYRIVQELLNNVLKHSQAATASLAIRVRSSRLLLEVEDDGRGFDPEFAGVGATEPGSGLAHIAERVRILGGTSRCVSRPADGTRWTIEIPVRSGNTA